MAREPAMPVGAFRTFVAVALGFAAIAWIIALAGVSAVTHVTSGNSQGLSWWIIWFEALLLLLVAFSLFANYVAGRAAILTLLAVVTVLIMGATDSYNSARRGIDGGGGTYTTYTQSVSYFEGVPYYFNTPHTVTRGGISDGYKARYNCAFAGFLLLSMANLLLLAAFGLVPSNEDDGTSRARAVEMKNVPNTTASAMPPSQPMPGAAHYNPGGPARFIPATYPPAAPAMPGATHYNPTAPVSDEPAVIQTVPVPEQPAPSAPASTTATHI